MSFRTRYYRPRPQRQRAKTMVQFSRGQQQINACMTGTVAGSVLTLTFDRPVILNGDVTTISVDVVGADIVSAEQTSPTEIEVTYDVSIVAATEFRMETPDPAIRTATGGFAQICTFPLGG